MIKLTPFAAPGAAALWMIAGVVGLASLACAQQGGNNISLKDGAAGYSGTEDFYTYRMEGGVFNSKTDLDDQTLRVSPMDSDAMFAMRFANIPLSRSSYGMVYRLALVLTFKAPPEPDTLTAHNLSDSDLWSEQLASYNSLNGSAPWSGANGTIQGAWRSTDAVAKVTGSETVNSTITIEFHENDAAARKALLDSWLDGRNQGFVVRGINGTNEFYSSDAYNPAHRPELLIDISSY